MEGETGSGVVGEEVDTVCDASDGLVVLRGEGREVSRVDNG